ncbi:hypothetical protein [Porphyrobacter sp. TH134]|nr:hypothetical protein [Porphyrobacter sp. TH134]
MTDHSSLSTPAKLRWETPALVHLELGLGDVQNGSFAGNDGNGGFTTSMS